MDDLRPLQQLPDGTDGRSLVGRGDWDGDQHVRDWRTIEQLRAGAGRPHGMTLSERMDRIERLQELVFEFYTARAPLVETRRAINAEIALLQEVFVTLEGLDNPEVAHQAKEVGKRIRILAQSAEPLNHELDEMMEQHIALSEQVWRGELEAGTHGTGTRRAAGSAAGGGGAGVLAVRE